MRAVAGTYGLDVLDAAILALVQAAMIVVSIAMIVSSLDVRLKPEHSRMTSWPIGLVAGALQGGPGISGPLLIAYFMPTGCPRPSTSCRW